MKSNLVDVEVWRFIGDSCCILDEMEESSSGSDEGLNRRVEFVELGGEDLPVALDQVLRVDERVR